MARPPTCLATGVLGTAVATSGLVALLAGVLLAAPCPLSAQSPASASASTVVSSRIPDWRVERGDIVRLQPVYGARLQGRFMGSFGDTLVVHPGGPAGPVAFTPDEITIGWVRDGGHGGKGALVGLAAGFLVKTIWTAQACRGPCAPSGVEVQWTLILMGGGAFIGSVIGGSIPRWRPLE